MDLGKAEPSPFAAGRIPDDGPRVLREPRSAHGSGGSRSGFDCHLLQSGEREAEKGADRAAHAFRCRLRNAYALRLTALGKLWEPRNTRLRKRCSGKTRRARDWMQRTPSIGKSGSRVP